MLPTERTDASANEQFRVLTPDGPYAINVRCGDGPYDVAPPFLCKATYRVPISVRISSNALLTFARLIYMGAGPKFSEWTLFTSHMEEVS